MLSVGEAIRVRRSTRRYTDRPVPDALLAHLLAFAAHTPHLTDRPPRVTVVSGRERVARILARYLGVYGLVQGAPHLLVGLIPEDADQARLDLGYVLEAVVLEATRLGLATCWMTGSYHPERAADEVERRPGEMVAATVALGYAREDPLARLHDGALRRLVGAHRRRPLEEIVFDREWGMPWSPVGADSVLEEVLEGARLAPSAENRQPWRFVVESGPPLALHLFLNRPSPIDAGIVMAHVALAGAEVGWRGRWLLRWQDRTLAEMVGAPRDVIPVGTFMVHD
ncbi:MAG: nitroreductase family protein [Anaerolineae bacterium]|nr:nitroreductase family protein [Anaerolineae bacterium]MDW8067320.1 nitroreductase family protein [Anaerolineae bacterium]